MTFFLYNFNNKYNIDSFNNYNLIEKYLNYQNKDVVLEAKKSIQRLQAAL